MPPRKFLPRARVRPINYGHNIPAKVAVSFFILGAAVVILTISLIGLIVSVKARFDVLTASINSLTMKDEFQREFENYVLSRRAIEKKHSKKIKELETKRLNAIQRLDIFNNLKDILQKFEDDLAKLSANVTARYAAYRNNDQEELRTNCYRLKDKAEKITSDILGLTERALNVAASVRESMRKLRNLKDYIKDLYPKNYRYYQLGGYPSPQEIWPFLDWNIDLISHRVFIQISDDTQRFGQQLDNSRFVDFENAFALDLTPDSEPEDGYYNLKRNSSGTHNLKLNLNLLEGFAPKSRRLTIWKLQNNRG